MSNAYFAFKQFTVHQDQCAMKVSTDACIQGAWTPVPLGSARVLDAGAGTGLLALMIAQRAPDVHIDAVELDPGASAQLAENVAASPFTERIHPAGGDVTAWQSPTQYELIVCNPPFFHKSLLGPDESRNAARHSASLNPESIARTIDRLLAPQGLASLMWPSAEHETFRVAAAASGLQFGRFLEIRDRKGGRVTRVIGVYSKSEAEPKGESLIIRQPDGNYTEAFKALLSPFYLYL